MISAPTGERPMQEVTFFTQGGVRVTNTRFVVDGQTFAMNNITSVKRGTTSPKRALPALLTLVGVWALAMRHTEGIALAVAGIAWLAVQRPLYHVTLHTAGGETNALTSKAKDYVDSIVTAVSNAIVHRG